MVKKDFTKKKLIELFEDDKSGKYPLSFDEALLLIGEYLNNKTINEWLKNYVDERYNEIFKKGKKV
jgi:hypothetical protein